MTTRRRRDDPSAELRGSIGAARGAVVSALALLQCCFGGACLAQSSDLLRVPEQSIKAAYLYKFANYVEWPSYSEGAPGSSITIGVLGAAALADQLAQITRGRRVNNHPVRVVRLEADDLFDDLHILFVGRQEAARLERLLLPARNRPILTVTETAGGLSEGSVINFTTSQERVRFEVSLSAAEEKRLRLDSRLLAVAESVQQEGQ